MKKSAAILFTAVIMFLGAFLLLSNKNFYTAAKENNNDYEHIAKDFYDDAYKLIDVPAICQYPELPTGCEATAAAMVLKYYGADITAEDFAREWLSCDTGFYTANGLQYGPDPAKTFAGDPFSKHSYGCYADPIVWAVNKNSTKCKARKIVNESLEALCKEYVNRGKPLLIWATTDMKQSKTGNTWYLRDGTEFTWLAGEHCLVLVGYNKDYYIFNDPQSGGTVSFSKETAQQRFKELGSQAVYISKSER